MKLVLTAACLLWNAKAVACTMDDFKITQFNWGAEGPYVRMVGEIANNCATDAGVELQVAFRKRDGQLVRVSKFWPASIRNIRAGRAYAFETLEDLRSQSFDLVEAKVSDVRTWDKQ